ncbi:MAG: glycosyltransferase family 2 protein [Planctomycetota bacterium]
MSDAARHAGGSAAASTDAPELSVLIVNYNSWRVCVDAVQSLLENPPTRADGAQMPFEVIVVDNNSPARDGEAESRLRQVLDRCGGTLVEHDENGGYSKGMNLAYRHARGQWLLVSNPDVLFLPGTLDELLRYAETHADAGAVAPAGYWDRGLECRLPPNILPTLGDLWAVTRAGISPAAARRYSTRRCRDAVAVWREDQATDLTMLSGCCFLMSRALIEQIGFFDERFPLYYEDTDISVRIRRAGRRVVHLPSARLVHLYNRSGETAHGEAMARYWVSRRAYYRKWYGPVGGWLQDLSRWFLATRRAQAWAQRPTHENVNVLPTSQDKPVIGLPRVMPYLVEISLDPRFYLAAGILGSGTEWSPSDALFANFGPATYYFRVCDLSGDEPREIGIWRYTRVYPDEWMQPPGGGSEQAEESVSGERS